MDFRYFHNVSVTLTYALIFKFMNTLKKYLKIVHAVHVLKKNMKKEYVVRC